MAASSYFLIQVKLPKNFDEKILKAIKDGFIDKVRGNIARVVATVEIAMNHTVEDNKHIFIPTDSQAGELGIQGRIGEGSIDEEKRSGAWRSLFTSAPNSAAVLKWEAGNSITNLGQISFGWDKEKFYSNPRSMVNVYNLRTGERLTIPWMKWFIEGELISGHHFSPISKGRIAKISRTGRGIMVQGGVWTFPPSSPGIPELTKHAANLVEKRLKQLFGSGKSSLLAITQKRGF